MGDGQQEQSSVLHCSSPKNHFDKECIHKMSNEHRSCICQFTNIFLQYQPWHKSSTVDLNAVSLRKTSKALQATAGRGRGHWLGLSVSGAATEQNSVKARPELRLASAVSRGSGPTLPGGNICVEEEWRCVVAVVASWCALVGVVLGLVWLQCMCRLWIACLHVIVCCVICLLLTWNLRRMRQS